ncbi:thioesterase II family protein [Streptomyces fuscichromogenes]|uniref:thioesterase II family protein n=1 Tax=Streptomyces fuscichromogenes TaxID=1324013 RepID=UPI0038171788
MSGGGEWLRRFHSGGSGGLCRLVCLPHAGGTASYFFPFSERLVGCADVVAVQYPGRQDRRGEGVLRSVGGLVGGVREALRGCGDGLPLVLFGHSMGAVVAFELARVLRGEGVEPAGVIVSGRRSAAVCGDERLHVLGDEALVEEVRVLSGTDPGLLRDREVLSMVLPALRADFEAVETYRYVPDAGGGVPLGCPLAVFTGSADPRVGVREARAWRELTEGAFSLRVFPGGHFYLGGQVAEVCEAVEESIRVFTGAGVQAPADRRPADR